MYTVLVLITSLIGLAAIPAAAQTTASPRTFYVDYASGSNSNNGTSPTSAWKTHPYMQAAAACTGTGRVPSYSHQVGDRFVFKGGVTWPYQCFGAGITAGGNSSSQDIYTGDATTLGLSAWGSGKAIFNLSGHTPTAASSVYNYTSFISVSPTTSYITFDDFEFVGQRFPGSGYGNANGGDCGIYFAGWSGTTGTGSKVTNSYFHGFLESPAALANAFTNCAGGVGGNGYTYRIDNVEVSGQDSQVDGYSVGQYQVGGCFANATEVKDSHCHHVAQGANGFSSIHDSEFDHITDSVCSSGGFISCYAFHTNTIQETWTGSCGYVYDNLIHDNTPGQHVAIYPCGAVYNNVFWNNSNGAGPILVDNGINGNVDGTGKTTSIYNNTQADCDGFGQCLYLERSGSVGTINYENNHQITSVANPVHMSGVTATVNQKQNVKQTVSTATSQGYTSLNRFAPAASSSATVNAGSSLSGICSGGLGALCSDIMHGARSASWDVGAYQFGSDPSLSSAPLPPSGLTATVQ
jgi:hypothetical protein